jgi:hypothetical protein
VLPRPLDYGADGIGASRSLAAGAPGVTHAFAAASGRDADLLIVIAPGVERFGYFRTLAEVMAGKVAPDSLVADQERYDTYFEQSAAWAGRAR